MSVEAVLEINEWNLIHTLNQKKRKEVFVFNYFAFGITETLYSSCFYRILFFFLCGYDDFDLCH